MILLLKALRGSRAYGLEREDSDYDWSYVYLEDFSELYGLTKGKGNYVDGEQNQHFTLVHFLHQLHRGSPVALETLFSPTITFCSRSLDPLYQRRFEFLTKEAAKAYVGLGFTNLKDYQKDQSDKPKRLMHAYRCFFLAEEILLNRTLTLNSSLHNPFLRQVRKGEVGSIEDVTARLKSLTFDEVETCKVDIGALGVSIIHTIHDNIIPS